MNIETIMHAMSAIIGWEFGKWALRSIEKRLAKRNKKA